MIKRRFPATTNRPPPADNPNLLLAALPAADYARIASTLSVVPLKLKEILYKPGERIQDVYFPGGGFCSMLASLEDGSMVEVDESRRYRKLIAVLRPQFFFRAAETHEEEYTFNNCRSILYPRLRLRS